MTHLDTTLVVDLLREARREDPGPAHDLLDRLADEELAVSVYVACELHAGAALAADPEAEGARVDSLLLALPVVLPGEEFAARYGAVLAELRRRGESVATMDLLIATSALEHDCPIVTRNVRDFERIPALHVLSY